MILNSKIVKYSGKINELIRNYSLKIKILQFLIYLSNIIFSIITLLLVIISTLNIAGGKYETSIAGDDYIIFSTFISSIITLINSFVSFFFLKEKINIYKNIKYRLIIERQKYSLNNEIYNNLSENQKERLFENKIFQIISGFEKHNNEQNAEGGV